MDEEQSPARQGFRILRKAGCSCILGNTSSFILDLPDKPVRRKDLANSHSLVSILGIAMTHSIHESFLQTELNSVRGHGTVHRLNELLHQRCQLQG